MGKLVFSEQLNSLFHDFYTMTGGINISIFESPVMFSQYDMSLNYGNVIVYPSIDMGDVFCKAIRKSQAIDRKCLNCDKKHNEQCMQSGTMNVYRCYLGLWEAQIPVKVEGQDAMAMIFVGQVDDTEPSDEGFDRIWKYLVQVDPDTFHDGARAYFREYYDSHLHRMPFRQFMAYCSFLQTISKDWNKTGLLMVRTDDAFDAIKNYINVHMTEVIRAEDLCESLHISRATLYRQIKNHSGVGFNGFVNQCKMQRACILLQHKYSVKETALMIGYENINYFSRLFKSIIGKTPTEYRNKSENE